MKGTNRITLTQASMIEAMQLWLDNTLAAGHGCRVTKVDGERSNPNSVYGGGEEFVVTVSAGEEA